MIFTAISGERENISGERHRVSRKDKAFTALPTDIPFSKGGARRDETHKREIRKERGNGGITIWLFTLLSHHYPLDHTASAMLSQFPTCPQMQGHNLRWHLPFFPACAQTWGMKDDQKGSGEESGNCDFDVVYDIFATFQQLPRCNFSSNYWSLPFWLGYI